MRLGYFGGTFDPPHLGHLAVARAAADAFALDRVLFIPTAIQPLKPSNPSASYVDRLAMVSLLCEADPRCEASDLETPAEPLVPNYTIDTLTRLHSKEPAAEIYVIVGIDTFHDLPHWRSPEQLIDMAQWIVLSRPHMASSDEVAALLPPLTPAQRTHVHLLPSFDHPASSTQIRSELLNGLSCEQLLAPAVLSYIREHHLYE